MNQLLSRYIDSGFVYRFMQNPDVVRNIDDAKKHGINCVSLAHLALRDLFAYELPHNLLCAELYADQRHFEHHDQTDSLQIGDLVWFGIDNPSMAPSDFAPEYDNQGKLVNWAAFPVKHVAVSTGEHDEQGDQLLLHSTYYTGTNVIWPLAKFALYKRYRQIYGVSRLKIDV